MMFFLCVSCGDHRNPQTMTVEADDAAHAAFLGWDALNPRLRSNVARPLVRFDGRKDVWFVDGVQVAVTRSGR